MVVAQHCECTSCPQNVHLKLVKMVNFFVLYIFPPFYIIFLSISDFMPKLFLRKTSTFSKRCKYFPHDLRSKYNILLIPWVFQETKFLITGHLKKALALLPSRPFSPGLRINWCSQQFVLTCGCNALVFIQNVDK